MYALNLNSLKVITEFNATTTRRFFSYNSVDFDYGRRRRRVGWSCKDLTRTCGIVACVGGGDGGGRGGGGGSLSSSSFLSWRQTYALLKQQMEVAAKSEDYKEAARIRDSLRSFEEEEPILRLRRSIKEAIAEERFEDAARYRDELKEIAPNSLLKCLSDATTLGIRVQVRSVYIEDRSQPSKGHYFYAYRVRITNNSDRPVQLLRRHWIITDANGKTENVWGVGVIGEQPVILPSTGFEYSSACPLSTPSGRMEGDFEMKHVCKACLWRGLGTISPSWLIIFRIVKQGIAIFMFPWNIELLEQLQTRSHCSLVSSAKIVVVF